MRTVTLLELQLLPHGAYSLARDANEEGELFLYPRCARCIKYLFEQSIERIENRQLVHVTLDEAKAFNESILPNVHLCADCRVTLTFMEDAPCDF